MADKAIEPGKKSTERYLPKAADPYDVLDRANLGYCQLFKFKCAACRTCDAWLYGGPIRD